MGLITIWNSINMLELTLDSPSIDTVLWGGELLNQTNAQYMVFNNWQISKFWK